VHRWSGLCVAGFLIIAGLTGSALAYLDELEALLLPEWIQVRPHGQPLSAFDLLQVAERLQPHANANLILLDRDAGKSARFALDPRIDPLTAKPYRLDFDEAFLDPYSGQVLGARLTTQAGFDAAHLLPTLHRLHYSLLLGGWGTELFGIVSLVWCANCLVGFYLTLPVRARGFFRVWKRSWTVRPPRSLSQLSFDLHRAAGLWAWLLLLIFALSAVQFTLERQIFRPLLTALLPFKDPAAQLRVDPLGDAAPGLGWRDAYARGRSLMTRHAAQQGFAVVREVFLLLDRRHNAYVYAVKSSLDIRDRGGQTRVYFGADDGRELGFHYPSITSGNAVDGWLSALHMSRIWGRPYQLIVSLLGLVTAGLSITGVLVWLKRRPLAA
jgi:uncharacterized iron-regulated membrane protein